MKIYIVSENRAASAEERIPFAVDWSNPRNNEIMEDSEDIVVSTPFAAYKTRGGAEARVKQEKLEDTENEFDYTIDEIELL